MAFHPYPQVIGAVFNPLPFGPPRGLTPASACPRIAHPASRLRPATGRPVRTRFRYGSLPVNLAAGRQLAGSFYKRHAVTAHGCSDCSRAHGFRYCFTPLPGCFSPFPHGTRALSVTGEYSGLEGGPPGFGPGFTCPALLRCRPASGTWVRVRGFDPLRPALPCRSAPHARPRGAPAGAPWPVLQPRWREGCRPRALTGLSQAPFRSPLLGGSRY